MDPATPVTPVTPATPATPVDPEDTENNGKRKREGTVVNNSAPSTGSVVSVQNPVDIALAECITIMTRNRTDLLSSGEEVAMELKSIKEQQQHILDLVGRFETEKIWATVQCPAAIASKECLSILQRHSRDLSKQIDELMSKLETLHESRQRGEAILNNCLQTNATAAGLTFNRGQGGAVVEF